MAHSIMPGPFRRQDAGGAPASARNGDMPDFSIVVLGNSAYKHCVDDIVLPLFYSLHRLGYKAEIRENAFSRHSVNIIFGLQDLPEIDPSRIPRDAIIYNFEQITPNSKALRPHYLRALKEFSVWEYSMRNYALLKEHFNVRNIQHVPLGYAPEMTRLDPSYPKDIDVLLYGSLNDRRKSIIEALQKQGVRAVGISKVFGEERDFLIARSRIVLNVHHYIPAVLEAARLGYLFANRKTVVSECNADTEVHAGYEESCIFAPYERLVERTVEALRAPKTCAMQAESAFTSFSARRYEDILEKTLDEMQRRRPKAARNTPPVFLNAGSGKDFRPDALNIDIEAKWNPDVLLDLSKAPDFGRTYETKRFGPLRLARGMFKKIRAFDVLEHMADVPQAMKNFLDLLCEGGELHVHVPYDLSHGAWQDPTHAHAFNENSWRYYTDWAWYLGWREYRFILAGLEYVLSEYGKKLKSEGLSQEEILCMPRAVDGMTARLIKRKATAGETAEYDRRHRAFYKNAVGEWTF